MMNLARLRAETGGFWNYCGCEVDMGDTQRDECYLQQQQESLVHHRMGEMLCKVAAHFDEIQRLVLVYLLPHPLITRGWLNSHL